MSSFFEIVTSEGKFDITNQLESASLETEFQKERFTLTTEASLESTVTMYVNTDPSKVHLEGATEICQFRYPFKIQHDNGLIDWILLYNISWRSPS